MPYAFYNASSGNEQALAEAGVPVSGSFEDLVSQVDIMLDAAPGGIGAKNKELYARMGRKAIFQGGEKNSVADVFFHGYANYAAGVGRDYLKLTSCNTTGLIRAVDCLDRAAGVNRVAITIIRASPTGGLPPGSDQRPAAEKAPSHQAVDLMSIMPHIGATGILVHTPVTHGHIITVLANTKRRVEKAEFLELMGRHPRIRVVRLADGFLGNASLFRYAARPWQPARRYV